MASDWVGLSDEEANTLWESTDSDWELMKRTEAKLREKNAGKPVGINGLTHEKEGATASVMGIVGKPAAEDKAGGTPVAYVDHADGAVIWKGNRLPGGTLLYVRPQPQADDSQKEAWRGLSDAEWMNIVNKNQAWFGVRPEEVAHEVCKLTEEKLREKNAKPAEQQEATCKQSLQVAAATKAGGDEPVATDKRMKVKLGGAYGHELVGHWFYLHPADEFAEKALEQRTGIAATRPKPQGGE